jgi:hypothetical protein
MDHPPWKVPLFVGHVSFRKRILNPIPKFTRQNWCLLSTEWCQVCWIPYWFCSHWNVSLFWGSQTHHTTLSLVSLDRYSFHLGACVVWRWVVHLGFEKQRQLESVKFLKTSNVQRPQILVCLLRLRQKGRKRCLMQVDDWKPLTRVKKAMSLFQWESIRVGGDVNAKVCNSPFV